MRKTKTPGKGYSSNLSQIKEQDKSESESDVYTSSDNQQPVTNSLPQKSREIQKRSGGSSADDKPNNAAPPPKKKSDLMIRVISSTSLISLMCLSYAMGHLYYTLLLFCAGFKCYWELLEINKNQRKEARIAIQNVFDWLIPIGFTFYLMPYTFVRRVQIDNDSLINFQQETPYLYAMFFKYHTFISSLLLIFSLVIFTISLEKGSLRYQFKRLGWQILITMSSISAPSFFGYYVFKGYFWVVICNGSVMMNDIMAYVFGKTFGRTKLIALSPNKTVEGFVGGGISTVLIAIWLSGYISQFQQIICPQTEINIAPFRELKCEVPELYIKQQYTIPILGNIMISEAQIHSAVISLFSAVVAPFGGFLASGLKRSLKIKDFSDSIPGHGGFADRFDCHIVCAFFVYMYLTQVVYRQGYNIERVFDYIQRMDESERRQIFNKLQEGFNLTVSTS